MGKGTLNLKALFTADASGIEKGSKDAKEAISEFDKSSSGMLDHFTGLFGTSMGEISAKLKVVQGGLLMMKGGLDGVTKSSNIFSKALKVLKVALISTGIGAILVALGALVSYFTKTQQGADKLAKMMVPLKVMFANVRDLASLLGEKIVWCFENPKEAVKSLWETIKSQFVNRIMGVVELAKGLGSVLEGVFTLDRNKIKQGALDVSDAFAQSITGMDEEARKKVGSSMKKIYQENASEIKKALELTDRSHKLEKEKIEFIKRRADIEAESEALKLKVEDRLLYTATEREKFNQKAMSLNRQLLEENIKLAKEEYEIKLAQDQLANNMNSDNEETALLYAAMVDVQKNADSTLKEMVTKQAELSTLVAQEALSREKMAKHTKLRAEMEIAPITKLKTPTIEGPIVTAQIQPTIDPDAIKGIADQVGGPISGVMLDLSDTITSGLSNVGVGIGECLGMMLSGEGGFDNFGKMIISTFADMAIQVGKIAIQMGMASAAIKLALNFGNPYVAIAAGIALVALGTAAKGAMANIADGAGSASSGMNMMTAGGSMSIPANSATSQNAEPINVNITGRLEGAGDALIGVINSTNNRNRYTGK